MYIYGLKDVKYILMNIGMKKRKLLKQVEYGKLVFGIIDICIVENLL